MLVPGGMKTLAPSAAEGHRGSQSQYFNSSESHTILSAPSRRGYLSAPFLHHRKETVVSLTYQTGLLFQVQSPEPLLGNPLSPQIAEN